MDKEHEIKTVCEELNSFLQIKNRNYGNSVHAPIRIFTQVDPNNNICIRLDDKLSRIQNSKELRKNDIVDIVGYLIHLCIQKGWTDFKDLIE